MASVIHSHAAFDVDVDISQFSQDLSISIVLVDGVDWGELIADVRLPIRGTSMNIQFSFGGLSITVDGIVVLSHSYCLAVNLPYRYDIRIIGPGAILYSSADEILFIDEHLHALSNAKIYSLSRSPSINNLSIELGCERFLTYVKSNLFGLGIKDKGIYVSGCGNGSECYVLLRLGAGRVVGVDPSEESLNIARYRFNGVNQLEFLRSHQDVGTAKFDLVISRHVLEHVSLDRVHRQRYIDSLFNAINNNGHVYIEVPNQLCPYEPHTGLLFFHLLDSDLQKLILRSSSSGVFSGYIDDKTIGLMNSVSSHLNVAKDEVLSYVPSHAKCINSCYRDSRNRETDDPLAPVMCFLFEVE